MTHYILIHKTADVIHHGEGEIPSFSVDLYTLEDNFPTREDWVARLAELGIVIPEEEEEEQA